MTDLYNGMDFFTVAVHEIGQNFITYLESNLVSPSTFPKLKDFVKAVLIKVLCYTVGLSYK